MNFFKRAYKYCIRKKVKSLILLLVLICISSFVVMSLGIMRGTQNAATNVRGEVEGKIHVEINPNAENMTESKDGNSLVTTYNGPWITEQVLEAILKVDGVVDCASENPQGFWGAGIENIKFLPASFSFNWSGYGDVSSFTAVLSSERSQYFEDGRYKLIDGRHIKPGDKHVVMISDILAEYNDLKVGDSITLYCYDSDANVKLEIIGIYEGAEGEAGEAISVDEIEANRGFVDYTTMNENFGREIDGYPSVDLYVEDPINIQNVYNRLENLPEIKEGGFTLTMDNSNYEQIKNPLEDLQKMVNVLLMAGISASILILTLILTIWIRNRKQEIGILLATGQTKGSVILQFWTEVICIAVFAFTLGVLLSNALKGIVQGLFEKGLSEQSMELIIRLNAEQIIQTCVIGIICITISVLLASISVLRFKPMNILIQQK